jgi:hypothetical protein
VAASAAPTDIGAVAGDALDLRFGQRRREQQPVASDVLGEEGAARHVVLELADGPVAALADRAAGDEASTEVAQGEDVLIGELGVAPGAVPAAGVRAHG